MLEIGSLVDGKYKILNKVGQGGMSVVYLAMNEKANKQWAIKEVRKDGIKDFEVVKQGLIVETDMLKKLSHPNLPSIIDVIENDDTFLIVMDYIQGNPLNKTLEEYGAQPQEYVIEWAKQLCDVLGYLHSRKPPIIYRDMKPANIMLKPDGNVTLIDFGTAREYKEKNIADTTCLGTVGYAAPEQFGGMGQTDARTDIYCLGATLYHLVTGMNPCEPPYEIKPIRQINPSLSNGLEKIILKCTQRDPNDRYQSCAELMYALEHYDEIDEKYRKKAWKRVTIFSVSVLLMIAFLGTSIWSDIAAVSQRSEDYDYKLSKAKTLQDYKSVILIDPTREDAYLKLVEYCKDNDGQITDDEIECFNEIDIGINDKSNINGSVKVLDELKESNPKGYFEVCYSIGFEILSLKQSNSIDSVLSDSVQWFSKANEVFKETQDQKELKMDDLNAKNELAELFCSVNNCLTVIAQNNNSRLSSAEDREKVYHDLFDTIGQIKDKIKNSKSFTDHNSTTDAASVQILVINILTDLINKETEGFQNITLERNGNSIELSDILDLLKDMKQMIKEARDISQLKSTVDEYGVDTKLDDLIKKFESN